MNIAKQLNKLKEQFGGIKKDIENNIELQNDSTVFISYSSKDKKYADKISFLLQNWGYGIWIDQIEMKGEFIDAEIENKLYQNIGLADCLLVLISKSSTKSDWVKKEYKEAVRLKNKGKNLLIVMGILDDCKIPKILKKGKYEIVDLRKDINQAILTFISNIPLKLQKRKDKKSSITRPILKKFGPSKNEKAILAYNQANNLFKKNDLEAALVKWDYAIELDPNYTDAIYNSACALYNHYTHLSDKNTNKQINSKVNNDIEKILKDVIDRYESLLKINPYDVDAMDNLAAAYFVSKEWSDSNREKQLLINAFHLKPDYGLTWLRMAFLLIKESGFIKVEDIIKGKLDSTNIDPNLLKLSKEFFAKAIELNPILDLAGQYKRVISALENILFKMKRDTDW